MQILIDGDGCPVVDIVLAAAKEHALPCLILCDTAHAFSRDGAQVLTFDKGADSVDYALVNRICPGDLVITQDYGLASMALARGARVLHQDGWEYTADNIDALLFQRHTARKLRASGGRMKGPKKRDRSQDQAFRQTLQSVIQTMVQE